METDLIFNQGLDLPGFASFPLLKTTKGRDLLKGYMEDLIALGQETDTGVILESPTWVASRDRGAAIGYSFSELTKLNHDAIAMMSAVRSDSGRAGTVISANIGPREDAYAPATQMNPDQAERYHAEQIAVLSETDLDVISGYTLAYSSEAIGMVRAARQFSLPVVISFTVGTDGQLPTGETLEQAISKVDAATDSYAAYYMINCAHPDHFSTRLEGAAWMLRVKGIVANASRCSHAELDEAEKLDDGNPTELGAQLSDIRRRFPHIQVLGGCCGTDMRHMKEIATAARTS
ncbi:homocysteine S-methyltransferase family protein [Shimia isoporae]|nr:homocysteine S-methyltransferase family protein [Shimia isoporae]